MLDDEYKQLGKHISAGAGFVSNLVLWSESGYFDNAAESKPLMHLWSLGIEEQFYIVWPLLLWVAWKRHLNLLTVTLLLALTSFFLNIKGIRQDVIAVFYSPQTRFWELLAGSILAWISLYGKLLFRNLKDKLDYWLGIVVYAPPPKADGHVLQNVQSIVGILLIAIAVITIKKEYSFPGWWALLPTLGTILIISAGTQAWINKTILSNSVLVWFGLISYPLYLWHWPLLSMARILESELPSREIRITATALAILLAWLTYKFIEKPIRFGPHKKQKNFILLILVIVIGYAGFNCWDRDGFRFRNSAQFRLSKDPAINSYSRLLAGNKNYIAELWKDRQIAIRAPYCHLNKDGQRFSEYKIGIDKCLLLKDDKDNILIIGDSYAADLYVGLSHAFPEINFLQATGAGCSPDIDYKSANSCEDLIRYAIAYARTHGVRKIVLAGRWHNLNSEKLRDLVSALKTHAHIYIVGPPATYTHEVKNILHRKAWRMTQSELSKRYIDQSVLALNKQMALFSEELQVNFIDRIKIFCNADGSCPLVSPEGVLYTPDSAHLVREGAQLLGIKLRQAQINFN